MSEFLNYMLASAEEREAYQQYNYASVKLEMARIMKRFAAIQSQADPINSRFNPKTQEEREQLIDLVRYVVIGRFKDI